MVAIFFCGFSHGTVGPKLVPCVTAHNGLRTLTPDIHERRRAPPQSLKLALLQFLRGWQLFFAVWPRIFHLVTTLLSV